MPVRRAVDDAGLDGQAELGGRARRRSRARPRRRRSARRAATRGVGALRLVEVERVADLGGDAADALEQDRRGPRRRSSRVALDRLERRVEADVAEPAAGVLEGERLALGELDGDGLEAAADDAGEEAGGPSATARLVRPPTAR